MNKNTICLWYNHDAEEAANFYARTFPDSKVSAVYRAPSDFPGGKAGSVLTVAFTVCGDGRFVLCLHACQQAKRDVVYRRHKQSRAMIIRA